MSENVHRTLAQRAGRVGYAKTADQMVETAKKVRTATGGDAPPKQPPSTTKAKK